MALSDPELEALVADLESDRVWIRVGPRRAPASAHEELRLAERRRAKDLPFELRPFPSATLADLNLHFFLNKYLPNALAPEVVAQNQRTPEEQLTSLRFMSLEGCPTALGLLVVGREPRAYLPGAYIQFLRINGTRLTDPIQDRREIAGPLFQVLRQLDETLSTQVQVATVVPPSGAEIRSPDYPMTALQQIARNAVLHRTYEGTNAPVRVYWFTDRVEIHNPGGPYGQVSRENFGAPGAADYRNPHLAEAMKALGFVQRFGVGIPMARDALQQNGNPAPEFHIEDTHVLAVMRRRP
jgi:ATP-dependent DNA helicase RecG